MHTPAAVEITGLVKKYGGRAVVNGLDLVCAPAQVTAILGPNGAGKTTTIECCEGLRTPDAGEIRILGQHPIRDAKHLRTQVGVMLQDGGLPAAAPSGYVLQHFAKMHARPRPTGELAERLGLSSFAKTPVRRLSGGQRQRLALAVAIIGNPELVFLDEPSAGLDPQSRIAVWELIRELASGGTSIVLTTHLMDEAAGLAHDIYVIDHGRVAAHGTPAELTGSLAGQQLTLEVPSANQDAAHWAQLCTELAATLEPRGAWEVRAEPNGRIVLTGPVTPAAIAQAAAWCAQKNLLLTSLTAGAGNLEDFFLERTGRDLR